MLMDEFYDGLPVGKRRIHFHRFFADLHSRAHELGSMGVALDHVVDGIRVLCFDEFHLDDVADAMFMARVLDTIVAKGVTVVVTSNVPPTDLLPNPLFHEQFVPSIELIERTLEVIELGGSVDYRTAGQSGAGDYRFATGEFLVGSGITRPSGESVELTIAHAHWSARRFETVSSGSISRCCALVRPRLPIISRSPPASTTG